jgi:hypothetical protein
VSGANRFHGKVRTCRQCVCTDTTPGAVALVVVHVVFGLSQPPCTKRAAATSETRTTAAIRYERAPRGRARWWVERAARAYFRSSAGSPYQCARSMSSSRRRSVTSPGVESQVTEAATPGDDGRRGRGGGGSRTRRLARPVRLTHLRVREVRCTRNGSERAAGVAPTPSDRKSDGSLSSPNPRGSYRLVLATVEGADLSATPRYGEGA